MPQGAGGDGRGEGMIGGCTSLTVEALAWPWSCGPLAAGPLAGAWNGRRRVEACRAALALTGENWQWIGVYVNIWCHTWGYRVTLNPWN